MYIIGNGFDSAHGIKSSYWQFHEWLMAHGHHDFVKAMEGMYNERNRKRFSDNKERISLLWTDFEKALGEIDAWSVQMMLQEQSPNAIHDRNAQKEVVQKIKKTVDDVSILIKEWAESIDISQAQRQFNLSKDSKYLTFNYTLTLEKCYHIDGTQICHIHNKVKDKEDKEDSGDEKLVVGCASDIQRSIHGDVDERQLGRKVNDELNRLNKPSDDLIDENDAFFRSLDTITRVVVIGHSMTEIDKPYLDHVKASVNKDAHWHFSAFKKEDYDNINSFIHDDVNEESNLARNVHYVFNIQMISEEENESKDDAKTKSTLEEKIARNARNKKIRHRLTAAETTAIAEKYKKGLETNVFTEEDKGLMRKIYDLAKLGQLTSTPAGILDKCFPDVDLMAQKENAMYYCRFVDLAKQQIIPTEVPTVLEGFFATAYRLRKLEKLGFIRYGVSNRYPITLLNKIALYDKMNESINFNPIPIPEDLVTIISRDSQQDVEIQDILYDAVESNFDTLKDFVP